MRAGWSSSPPKGKGEQLASSSRLPEQTHDIALPRECRLINNQKEVYGFRFDGVFPAEATQEQVQFSGQPG